MGLFVKICGLTSAQDVEKVAECGPDAIGFVFWPGSPRAVTVEAVGEWTAGLPDSILRVGVFVDEEVDVVRRAWEVARLNVVQLHGNESPGYCLAVPGRCWKAIHLDRGGIDAGEYQVDAFLADSYSAAMPGGTGRVADWEKVREFVAAVRPRPVILAGGLRPENVAEAVRRVRPWGVDVSSGVESSPGRKDIARVKDFVAICREL